MSESSGREEQLARLRDEMSASPELQEARGEWRLVHGTGNPNAKIVLLGEAPGAQEDKAGKPFVGPAGKLLNEALEAVGLERDDVWTTNVVKFRPTLKGENGRLRNRPPSAEEARTFLPYLERELQIVGPEAIICLGATAAEAVLGRKVQVTKERGQWERGPLGIATMPTYHPAFLLRRMPGWEARYDEFIQDLRAGKELAPEDLE